MRVKEESEKASLKLNIQKTKIMASGPITSWQIDGEEMEIVANFIFLGSKLLWTVIGTMKLKDTCSLEESYNKPRQHTKKSKSIILLTNVYLVKAMVFPVVGYGCESWTIKKAEHQRTDALELWCWRRH